MTKTKVYKRTRVVGNCDNCTQYCLNLVCSNKFDSLLCPLCYRRRIHSCVNKDARNAYYRAYRINNPKRVKSYEAKYIATHREYVRSKNAARKSSVYRATPKCLKPAVLKDLRAIYANRPKGHHVDHIVPLRGKTVCGLHVPWNLQYLPATENIRKQNKVAA